MRAAPATVALVTHRPSPPGVAAVDMDTPPLSRVLGDLGIRSFIVPWNDTAVQWADFDLVVLRSTWDYDSDHQRFLEWIGTVASVTAVLNPPALIRWGLAKDVYLPDLARNGVPIVPTVLIPPAADPRMPAFEDFVVKPSIGAGSRRAARYTRHDEDEATAHMESLHEIGLTVVIQPYDARVDQYGERSMIFIDGEFSHAIKKGPVLPVGTRRHHKRIPHPHAKLHTPSEDELVLGRSALAIADPDRAALYARIDAFSDDGQNPTAAEVEVVEPNLFLKLSPSAISTMAKAIANRLEKAASSVGRSLSRFYVLSRGLTDYRTTAARRSSCYSLPLLVARPGSDMNALALWPEQAEYLHRPVPGAAKPVRNPSVEFSHFTHLQHYVLVTKHKPTLAAEHVEPLVALVGTQVGLALGGIEDHLQGLEPTWLMGE